MTLTIPDISEWQGTPDLTTLKGKAVIIRLHNGYRNDTAGAVNRAHAHAVGVRAVGLYGYVVAATDPAQQGRGFAAAIGTLQPGEFIVADMEEGAGDQSQRVETYLQAVHRALADNNPDEFIYSGLYFWKAHLGTVPASSAHRWVAAYQSTDPKFTGEQMWQFTDAYTWPWGRSDASTFDGTVDQLLALLSPIDPASTVKTVTHRKRDDMIQIVRQSDHEPSATWVVDGNRAVLVHSPADLAVFVARMKANGYDTTVGEMTAQQLTALGANPA